MQKVIRMITPTQQRNCATVLGHWFISKHKVAGSRLIKMTASCNIPALVFCHCILEHYFQVMKHKFQLLD